MRSGRFLIALGQGLKNINCSKQVIHGLESNTKTHDKAETKDIRLAKCALQAIYYAFCCILFHPVIFV